MSNTKAFIMVATILAVIAFVVFGYREIKKNEKRSFGDTSKTTSNSDSAKEPYEYSFKEIINSIIN